MQSDHKFAHVATAQLSWHVQTCDLIWSSFFTQKQHQFLTRCELWAPKPFLKRVSGDAGEPRFEWGDFKIDGLMIVVNLVVSKSRSVVVPVSTWTITWTNAVLLFIVALGTNFSDVWIKIPNFSFTKKDLNVVCEMAAGEFPTQMASNAENISIWWRHHMKPTTAITSFIMSQSIRKLYSHIKQVSHGLAFGMMRFLSSPDFAHSRSIPMYNARLILWPPSFSSCIRNFLNMRREWRRPRWIKKTLHIGINWDFGLGMSFRDVIAVNIR